MVRTRLEGDRPDSGRAAAIRVMVVDDSPFIRGVFKRVLKADPGIELVASVANGQLAVDAVKRRPIDIVLLDIEMPVMDGLTALPRLIAASPKTKVIMASTLTRKNAEVSLKALAQGASDYIPKPSSMRELSASCDFGDDLLSRIHALAGVNGGAKLVHPGGATLVHLTLCGTRCWGVVPVVHRRDPRCFV